MNYRAFYILPTLIHTAENSFSHNYSSFRGFSKSFHRYVFKSESNAIELQTAKLPVDLTIFEM